MSEYEMRKDVHDALSVWNPDYRLRQDYCGSMFDLSKLEFAGFKMLDEFPELSGAYILEYEGEHDFWIVDCQFDQNGELWDLAIEGWKKEDADVILSPSGFMHTENVRLKLESALVASFKPA